MQIKYSLGHASPKLVEDAFDLRQQVFTHEQGFPADIDVDEYDDTALHVVLYLNQHPAAVLRCILFEETGLVKVAVLRYKNSIEEKG
ncbi:GNAT family N-acetyltransferase [Providencia rettgeri]|uniref:GNAT family N-acetyltransferase n=1 Tax=Providencia rettgeri TaxID=587 RepID=UPI001FFABCCF|nr:GNAT family N-acetyltransferase [Providencia rettgeri]